jgi:hypothetical protein
MRRVGKVRMGILQRLVLEAYDCRAQCIGFFEGAKLTLGPRPSLRVAWTNRHRIVVIVRGGLHDAAAVGQATVGQGTTGQGTGGGGDSGEGKKDEQEKEEDEEDDDDDDDEGYMDELSDDSDEARAVAGLTAAASTPRSAIAAMRASEKKRGSRIP